MRDARLRHGYSLDTLSSVAGIAKNSALRAEHGGEITPSTARKLATALGLTPGDLLPLDQPLLFQPEEELEEEQQTQEEQFFETWQHMQSIVDDVYAHPELYGPEAVADKLMQAAAEGLQKKTPKERRAS